MMISAAMNETLSLTLPNKVYNLGRIIVMERCPMIQAGIRHLLEQPSFQVESYLETSTIVDIPKTIVQHRANLAIVELAGERESVLEGLRAIRQIQGAVKKVQLVVCTSLTDARLLKQLFSLGVRGIYHKQDPLSALCQCVFRVMDRQAGFSPHAAELLADRVCATALLTSCEMNVLEALCTGKSLTDIAHTLFRDIRTVSTHKRNAMNKLALQNNGELYSWLARHSTPA